MRVLDAVAVERVVRMVRVRIEMRMVEVVMGNEVHGLLGVRYAVRRGEIRGLKVVVRGVAKSVRPRTGAKRVSRVHGGRRPEKEALVTSVYPRYIRRLAIKNYVFGVDVVVNRRHGAPMGPC